MFSIRSEIDFSFLELAIKIIERFFIETENSNQFHMAKGVSEISTNSNYFSQYIQLQT